MRVTASLLVIEHLPEKAPSPDHTWTHEDASEMMFDELVKENNVPINQDDVNFIKDLIKGTVRHSARK